LEDFKQSPQQQFLEAAVAEAKMFPKTASNHINGFLKGAGTVGRNLRDVGSPGGFQEP
jgi:hypothetical protein